MRLTRALWYTCEVIKKMVDYSVQGKVAVLEVNNPPVNAFSYNVRVGLLESIDKAVRDRNVKAIVICGKGRTFPAGADIREFDKPPREPWLTEVLGHMERCSKPVVASIHGTCLGGGLECALFCHYRIAQKSARVGFPEVNIGILPGAAGTQRLPRLTGLRVAMDMITSGRHVSVPEAVKFGIIDEVFTGDVVNAGIKFAMSVMDKPLADRRLRNRKVKDADQADKIADEFMLLVKKKYRGFEAPIDCVKAVKASATMPYEEGLQREKELMRNLLTSGQSAAQRYAFFAERAVTRWRMPGANFQTTKPLPVKSTAVIGAGTMGSGIAVCLLNAGYQVFLLEQNEKFLENGVKTIRAIIEGSVKLGKTPMSVAQRAAQLLIPTMKYEDLKDTDLVIEAVYENLALKREIFAKLDKICKPSTILCSNTSSLDIDRIATATTREDRVAGMHFFAPAFIMRLLENIYSTKSSPSTVATIMDVGKKIGKVSVLVKSCQSFLANRMRGPFAVESTFLVEEGASPIEVDSVMENLGLPMGPFKVSDLSGIDVGYKIQAEIAKALGVKLTVDSKFMNGERICTLSHRLFHKGRLGRKTGKGWYKYEKPGGKIATYDDEVTQIIEEHCKQAGIQRRKISTQEIFERLMYSSINQGFLILDEGVAASPEDIDISWIYGFSWPKYLGGPMYYANKIGLDKVYQRICYYHEHLPYSSHWVPSKLLKRLSENNVPMDQWCRQTDSKL